MFESASSGGIGVVLDQATPKGIEAAEPNPTLRDGTASGWLGHPAERQARPLPWPAPMVECGRIAYARGLSGAEGGEAGAHPTRTVLGRPIAVAVTAPVQ